MGCLFILVLMDVEYLVGRYFLMEERREGRGEGMVEKNDHSILVVELLMRINLIMS